MYCKNFKRFVESNMRPREYTILDIYEYEAAMSRILKWLICAEVYRRWGSTENPILRSGVADCHNKEDAYHKVSGEFFFGLLETAELDEIDILGEIRMRLWNLGFICLTVNSHYAECINKRRMTLEGCKSVGIAMVEISKNHIVKQVAEPKE